VKVLLWTVDSPWTLNFVKNFLLEKNYEVWVPNRGDKEYTKAYREYGVHLIELPQTVTEPQYIHFGVLKAAIKSGPFDIINMQYVEYQYLADLVILKFIFKAKLVLSYWGSDLLRVGDRELGYAGRFSRFADFVTFDNIDLELKFKKTYKWAGRVPKETVMLGLPVLDHIKGKPKGGSKDGIRKKWGVGGGKVVIAIGYNGIPQQQHKKVLRALESLDNAYKEKIVLLLQMSYGGTRSYRDSVVAAARRAGFQYIDIQRFLTDGEVAEIRVLTDIFINAQVTDAFSGSVCECLFAGAVLINAKWLRYKELGKYSLGYLEFGGFNEIGQIIEGVLKAPPDVKKNTGVIWQLRSWERCAPKWENVYRRMCSHAEGSSDFGGREGDKALPIYRGNAQTPGSHR